MSKKINLSAVTSSAAMPIKTGTLNFLQEAYQEVTVQLARSLATTITGKPYIPTTPYAISGCTYVVFLGTLVVTNGMILYDNELYIVPGASMVPGTLYAHLDVTNFTDPTADPVTFRDTTTHNVHDIRRIVFNTTSAGALFAVSDVVYLNSENTLKAVNFWIDVTITGANWASGVIPFGGAVPSYRRDAMGTVRLRGSVKSTGSPAGSQVIATLPAGYRPDVSTGQHYFLCPVYDITSSLFTTPRVLMIDSSGQISPIFGTTVLDTTNWVYLLDGISFPTLGGN